LGLAPFLGDETAVKQQLKGGNMYSLTKKLTRKLPLYFIAIGAIYKI